jgi:dipeptidyl aminopeptidase/acylaminoacyl peptidase
MRGSLVFAAILGLAALGLGQDTFEPMDVFELEWASDPQISPDGTRIVYVRNSMDVMEDRSRRELWIVGADGKNHRRLTRGSSPRWSPDGARIAFIEDSQIHLRWMDTGESASISQLTESPSNIVWSPDGEWIAFSMLVAEEAPKLVSLPRKPEGAKWADPPELETRVRHRADGRGDLPHGFEHLFVIPAEGGTARQITSGSFHHRSAPAWTPDGKALVFSSNRNESWEREFRNSEIYRVSIEDGAVVALTDRDGPDHSPVVSPDGKRIAYLGYDDQVRTYQVTELYVMNADGSDKRLVTDALDRSVSSPVWSPDGLGVLFQYDDRGNTKVGHAMLDGEVRVLADNVGGTSYGRPYGGGSFSVAGDEDVRFAFTLTRPEHPGDVAIGTRDTDSVTRVTRLNEDLLSSKRLGNVEEIWWKSSYDQRDIQGWIVTPPDFDPRRKYPLILEIHGGPISNYGDRFSAEIQLMASMGYVVLYANPRGSTSYGAEFGDLLYHNYPGQDYDDLISGVDAVIAKGYIDERNLFVTGGSAGGIMTAWIVGKTDRFRAAVAAKPVINWYSKVLVADNYYGYHEYRYPGSPWENPEDYMKFSPISLVGNVSTPTMMLTGTEDLRTPLSESYQFYHALKLRGVDTAVVRIPGASHNIVRRPSQLIAKILNVVAWFEKYRAGDGATAPTAGK